MSVDTSDLTKLIRVLSKKVVHEKVQRKAALLAHTETVKRIFPARGRSKDSKNQSLGRYDPKTRKQKRKEGHLSAGINLQWSGQLEKSWGTVPKDLAGVWTSGFFISGRRGSKISNEELAKHLEDRYGLIFESTKEEEAFYAEMLEKYMAKELA